MKALRTLAALVLCGSALDAQIVVVNSATLGTVGSGVTTHTYTGLDANGTNMTATASTGGIMQPGPGSFPGLYFGGNQSSATYTFTFNTAVKFFEFYFTAQSTVLGQYSEVFTTFVTNGGTRTYSFTNVGATSWDGTSITSTQGDGRSILGITVGAGESFTSVSFSHVQTGVPNGSVIERIRYERAGTSSVVPEPQTYALLASGLVVLAGVARRKRLTGA